MRWRRIYISHSAKRESLYRQQKQTDGAPRAPCNGRSSPPRRTRWTRRLHRRSDRNLANSDQCETRFPVPHWNSGESPSREVARYLKSGPPVLPCAGPAVLRPAVAPHQEAVATFRPAEGGQLGLGRIDFHVRSQSCSLQRVQRPRPNSGLPRRGRPLCLATGRSPSAIRSAGSSGLIRTASLQAVQIGKRGASGRYPA